MKNLRSGIALFFLFCFLLNGYSRIKYSINDNWKFQKGDFEHASEISLNDSAWEKINIPHTWNVSDAMDEETGYYRGISWYRKNLTLPLEYSGKQITIYFEGANQTAEIFVNGVSAGFHIGGYTRFSFNITPFLKFGEKNVLAVKVDNSYQKLIPPLSADFTFFGGIYRDVYLIVTENIYISTTHYASDGVYISTPIVNKNMANLSVKTMLNNATSGNCQIKIEHTLFHPDGTEISINSQKIKINKNASNVVTLQEFNITNPSLWSPEFPQIYRLRTRITDSKSKNILDEVYQPVGFRWFEFSVGNGFMLNGKSYKLIGTNRHQCFDGLGNALPDEIHVRDIKLIKEMGGNFLRVSHYPQDPVLMEMCDKTGIITSVEIPVVNAITEHADFYKNCIEMAREMVLQDFNRPSVLIWSYMNEVMLQPPFINDSVRHAQYLKSVQQLAEKIENQIRNDDPYRYTIIPFHGNFERYKSAGLTEIPKIIGWNLYQGWYGNTFDAFGTFLDTAHEKLKDKPFIITEYGADVDPRLHTFDPVRFDYTQEYANLYHEHYIKDILSRKFIVGANIWNLNDFHSEERENAVPHVNNKGITTLNRDLKDTYLYYQSMLNHEPEILIGGRSWTIRGGVCDENHICYQPVKIYSNINEVELFLNGRSLGKKKPVDFIAEFNVPFVHGKNILDVAGIVEHKTYRDQLKLEFHMIPSNLKDSRIPFKDINVMLGSKRYFEDKQNDVIWIPEQEYSPGSWGYTGGTNYVKRTRHGQQPASDLNIKGTDIDPVFQTMRQGIRSFKFDVPDGEYTLSLYFAELLTSTGKTSIYNLGDDSINEDVDERIFNVNINKVQVLKHFNITREFGPQQAVIKKFAVQAKDGQGISIDFESLKGEPVLNALRLYRNY